jgi:hypothetical protein
MTSSKLKFLYKLYFTISAVKLLLIVNVRYIEDAGTVENLKEINSGFTSAEYNIQVFCQTFF